MLTSCRKAGTKEGLIRHLKEERGWRSWSLGRGGSITSHLPAFFFGGQGESIEQLGKPVCAMLNRGNDSSRYIICSERAWSSHLQAAAYPEAVHSASPSLLGTPDDSEEWAHSPTGRAWYQTNIWPRENRSLQIKVFYQPWYIKSLENQRQSQKSIALFLVSINHVFLHQHSSKAVLTKPSRSYTWYQRR